MTIRTASGTLETSEIDGLVLAHEHLAIDLRTPGDTAGVLTESEEVSDELSAARAQHGLRLVVDLTCRGMGRDVAASARIAARAGVEVVVATGYYYERFHPAGELEHSPEEVAAVLVREAHEGIEGTGIRPGVLGEIGSSGTATPAERTSLIAAAIAAQEAGLSVGTHAHLGRGGLEQLDLLIGAGLAPQRIVIGHQDLIQDAAQHGAIARSGAYLAFDTVGKESYQSDAVRLRMLLELIEAGHERHIVLSNDVSRDAYLTSRGGPGYGHVLGPFRAALIDAGVTEQTLDLLYRDNALRWLEGA